MTIPKAVIMDLYPLYLEGEISNETKAYVDAYLADHPQFAEHAKQLFDPKTLSLPNQEDQDLSVLQQTQRLLQLRSICLALGLLGVVGTLLFYTFFDFSVANMNRPHLIYWLGRTAPFAALFSLTGYGWIRYRLRTSGF